VAHPDDELCSDEPAPVTVEAARTLFNETIADYSNLDDGFDCSAHFSPNNTELLATCASDPVSFMPEGYTIQTIVEETLHDENPENLSYTVSVDTDDETKYIVFEIGLEFVGEVLYISSWAYEVIDNPNFDSQTLFIYQFIADYNNTSLSSSNVCSTYIENAIEASNCSYARDTKLEGGYQMAFLSKSVGTYYLFYVNAYMPHGGSGSEGYIVTGTEGAYHIREASAAFYPTSAFDTETIAFIYEYINETLTSSEVCDFLDSGVSACQTERDDYLETGFFTVNDMTSSYYYDGTNLYYYRNVTIDMRDETMINIRIQAKVLPGGDLEYTIVD